MNCYVYGGEFDPCHLNYNNDVNDGVDKDPSNCSGGTFYFWDEPDAPGRSYARSGAARAGYAAKFGMELMLM
jgi:hypothetical protein